MAVQIVMPTMGLTMEEGTIVKWLKREGDFVKKGENLLEIETDKLTTEVESNVEGHIIKILVQEGETVPVQNPIAIVGEEGEFFEIAVPSKDTNSKTETNNQIFEEKNENPAMVQIKKGGKVFISPRARNLAEKNGIDYLNIKGSGEHGRIMERDIINFHQLLENEKKTLLEVDQATNCTAAKKASNTIIPLKGIRKIIAEKMAYSVQTSPHTYFSVDMDVTNLEALRKALASQLTDIKPSINDFIIKAAGKALRDFPMVNSKIEGNNIVLISSINVGIAVGLDQGIVVPAIKDANKKSITEVSKESKELIRKAKDGSLQLDELSDTTFTISNLGMYGIKAFTAIINPPQSAILAVGSIREVPVIKNGEIKIGNTMTFTLSSDHRIIDGLQSAQFINRIKYYLENPLTLLINS